MTREDIILALECCQHFYCSDECPYHKVDETIAICANQLKADARELLIQDRMMEDDGK